MDHRRPVQRSQHVKLIFFSIQSPSPASLSPVWKKASHYQIFKDWGDENIVVIKINLHDVEPPVEKSSDGGNNQHDAEVIHLCHNSFRVTLTQPSSPM